jgi:trimethylamine--corrinoid protein Co-methyltransferase
MPSNQSSVAVPQPEQLTLEEVELVHERTMTILSKIGIRVDHEEAREILADHGATVEEATVTLPRSLVEDCIESAPSSFTLHARNPDNDVQVGEGDPVTAPAYGPPNVRTYEDGRRPSTLDDYETLVKLAHSEDVIRCVGYNCCEPNDVDQEVKHVEMVERSLRLSDKPVMSSNYGADRARATMTMAGIANGDPDLEKPYVVGLANSVPPRRWDEKMTGGLLEHARHGQPVVVAPGVMASASGPATLAGTLALTNANSLFGVVMTQVVQEGAPVVYGCPSSNIDVRYGSFAIGSPEGGLAISFTGQMGRYYDLPTRSGGALTDSKTVDDQAGAESMRQLSLTMQADVDFVLHAAGILESYSTVSPEKFVLDCERLRHLERFRAGYDLTEESFALDLIEEVAPDDHFLNRRHTLEHSKSEFYFSELFDRQSHSDWQDDGEPDAFERGHERVQTLLDEYERPAMPSDVERDLDSFTTVEIERIRE